MCWCSASQFVVPLIRVISAVAPGFSPACAALQVPILLTHYTSTWPREYRSWTGREGHQTRRSEAPHPSRPAGTPSPLGEGGEFVGAVSARINPCPSTFSCTGAPGPSQYARVQPFFSSLPDVERTTYLQSKLPLRSATIHGSAVATPTYRATAPRTISAPVQ